MSVVKFIVMLCENIIRTSCVERKDGLLADRLPGRAALLLFITRSIARVSSSKVCWYVLQIRTSMNINMMYDVAQVENSGFFFF